MFNRIFELFKSMTELCKEYRELRSNFVKLKFFQDLLSLIFYWFIQSILIHTGALNML
jgi:hypothetical protein